MFFKWTEILHFYSDKNRISTFYYSDKADIFYKTYKKRYKISSLEILYFYSNKNEFLLPII